MFRGCAPSEFAMASGHASCFLMVSGPAMPALILDLSIPSHQLVAYYRGQIRTVRARAVTGQMVQFPVSALQKHILKEGVHGRFRIEFDEQHKFVALEPVE
jgi:hypothetical protein